MARDHPWRLPAPVERALDQPTAPVPVDLTAAPGWLRRIAARQGVTHPASGDPLSDSGQRGGEGREGEPRSDTHKAAV